MSIQNFIKELSALFDFQVIRSIKSSLVNSASKICFFGFSFTRANKKIKSKNVINGKLLRIYSLFKGFFVDDDLVSINQMLL
jgi:hypothetical protein